MQDAMTLSEMALNPYHINNSNNSNIAVLHPSLAVMSEVATALQLNYYEN